MPSIDDPAELRARVAQAAVARLATVRPDGTPRLVPITFALLDGLICSAVDEVKAKRSTRLARLADVARDPRVGLVIDHYAEDWSTLWWVRIDGTAQVLAPPGPPDRAVGSPASTDQPRRPVYSDPPDGAAELRERALDALVEKYPPYRIARPASALLVITPARWTGWSAR